MLSFSKVRDRGSINRQMACSPNGIVNTIDTCPCVTCPQRSTHGPHDQTVFSHSAIGIVSSQIRLIDLRTTVSLVWNMRARTTPTDSIPPVSRLDTKPIGRWSWPIVCWLPRTLGAPFLGSFRWRVSQIFKEATHRKKRGGRVIPSLLCLLFLVELLIIGISSCAVKYVRKMQL